VGNLQVFPADLPEATTSVLNFRPGLAMANHNIIPLSRDGAGTLKIRAATAAPVHLIVDVTGYFADAQ
jgi:hypothetical protein